MYKTILNTAIAESRETLDGRLMESDVGHWQLARTVELPFRPRRGTVLITDGDDDADTQVYFRVRRVVYDLTQHAWRAYGALSVLLEHESTPESLKEQLPEWEAEWIDRHCFDEEGNFVAHPDEETNT